MERIELVHGAVSKLGIQYMNLKEKVGNMKGRTLIITGASRGIGLGIGVRAAQDGANIVILAKSDRKHKKLDGTIYTAAEAIRQAGGKCLPLRCDVRDEKLLQECVDKTIEVFGRIDVVINNASVLSLLDSERLSIKKFDLMNQINFRASWMLVKMCVPHLKKSPNPHIINISPPINLQNNWFENHTGYSIVKFGATMMSWGFALEFKQHGIACNTLWPQSAVATAAVRYELGGDQMMQKSRKVTVMGDSAYEIMTANSRKCTGNFFMDDEVLKLVGVTDFKQYRVDPNCPENELMPDLFLNL